MKLTRKIVVALAVLMAAGVAYAEIPDVSKWDCLNNGVAYPDYGVETTFCDVIIGGYITISGELVYIHEHRTNADKTTIYYNALKTNEGSWVEVVNKIDLIFSGKEIENNGIMMSIFDDNGNIVAKRFVSLLKK